MFKCLLIPILVGLISAILGYLLGRLLGKGKGQDNDIAIWKDKVAKLEADLAACKSEKLEIDKAKKNIVTGTTGAASGIASSLSATAAKTTTTVKYDASAAKAAYGKNIKENDLTVVEGIGPKIQSLFHNFGVKTWAELAACSIAKCQEVLDSGGAAFKMHNPKTWPKQADFAAKGKWQELKKWQDELDGGR
ncbi:hypothetical protein [Tenacibaculum sp. UWU-22]|uniref:hypothetical protein n=1 Tax=Tenacibaculum sp. UWU-22 TaxID=3234187 RepID=UPI0034DB7134